MKDALPTVIWKDGIANIDNGNNDWDDKNPDNIYAANLKKHVWATNF